MYYEEADNAAVARSTSLVEELGQIDFIFSDKTGTLTRNIMEFKEASIGGVAYKQGTPNDFEQLKLDEQSGSNKNFIQEFLTLLAVCHTVIPEYDEKETLSYQASSPDEAALVDGAKDLGYLFHTRRPKSVSISVNGHNQEYEILAVNEFNSTRKRMSVLVRCPNGKVKLMIKGADTVIFDRLDKGCAHREETLTHLEDYALVGLRTLALAMRDIPDEEYKKWKVVQINVGTIRSSQCYRQQ